MFKKFTHILMIATTTMVGYAQAQVNYITTNDQVKLYSKKAGNGPVCIFVHGGPGAWSKSFEELGGNQLEKELTMIYYDQRGSGRSDNAQNQDYSLERMIDDIDQVRQYYKTDKIFLMGHSFGGILIENYAKKYPQHLKGLIFLNSTINIPNSMEAQIQYMKNHVGKEAENTNDFSELRMMMRNKDEEYKLLTDSKANHDLLDQVDASEKRNYDFAQKGFSIPSYLENFSELTKSIQTPALVITGTQDYSIGVNHYMLFQFPHQTIKHLKGGHILYYENNQEFTKTVFDFVKQINRGK